jgi:hypothetical protein
LVSAVLGLATARSLSSFIGIPDVAKNAVSQSTQKNIVIIYVDDLDAKDPQLVSVWSLFSVVNEQSYITMTPLYPGTVPDPALSLLTSSFDLNGRKKPVKGFLEALQAFQVTWDGYILVDHQGMMALHQWLAGNPADLGLTDQGSKDAAMILQEESLVLTGICHGLNQTGPAPGESTQWDAIFPDHLKTDLSMRSIIPHWQQMNEEQAPLVCNVFSH